MKVKYKYIWMLITVFGALTNPLFASPEPEEIKTAAQVAEEMQTNLNIVWTCVAAFLVFFMQAGFSMVEAGFTRAKNTINIMMKNLMDFSIGTLAFFFIGFGLMFGATNGLFGTTNFMMAGTDVAGERLELDVSDFPDRFRRDSGNHCFRGHGGTN